jgi:hypothetical protein
VGAPSFIQPGGVGEQGGVDVGCGALAPGEHVKAFCIHVLEKGWGPAAAVEPDQDPPLVADGPA